MKNKVTQKDIDKILKDTKFKTQKYGDKTTIVMATLPNDFVIVESSSCVDPKNFDMAVGEQICMEKITDKIWELEGYKLQDKVNNNKNTESLNYNDVLDDFQKDFDNLLDDLFKNIDRL